MNSENQPNVDNEPNPAADKWLDSPELHDLIQQAAEQEANGEISEEEARHQTKVAIGEIATKFAATPEDVAAYDTEPVGQFQLPSVDLELDK